MNRQLLLSIRPKHLVNILNGKKTLELRKSVPKDFVGWVNLYCSKARPELHFFSWSNEFIGVHFTEDLEKLGTDYLHAYSGVINGKVVARFWFDEYGELIFNLTHWRFEYNAWGEDVSKDLCLTTNEIMSYRANKNITLKNEKGIFYYPSKNKKPDYLWRIKRLEIFDRPKELSDFGLTKAPQSYQYVYVKE